MSETVSFVQIVTAVTQQGALLYGLAALEDLRVAGTAVIVGNLLFSIFAVVVVVADWFPLTAFGARRRNGLAISLRLAPPASHGPVASFAPSVF